MLDLLGLKPERAIGTPTSGYVFIAQLRAKLPNSIGNLLWFAYGPADTSCFIPLYAGVTDLPASWNQPANFTRIDRQQAQWNFRLINSLVQRLPYQPAIKEVEVAPVCHRGNILKISDLQWEEMVGAVRFELTTF